MIFSSIRLISAILNVNMNICFSEIVIVEFLLNVLLYYANINKMETINHIGLLIREKYKIRGRNNLHMDCARMHNFVHGLHKEDGFCVWIAYGSLILWILRRKKWFVHGLHTEAFVYGNFLCVVIVLVIVAVLYFLCLGYVLCFWIINSVAYY